MSLTLDALAYVVDEAHGIARREVADAAERAHTELVAIVKDLSAVDEVDILAETMDVCVLCPGREGAHKPECPWQRAVTLIGQP